MALSEAEAPQKARNLEAEELRIDMAGREDQIVTNYDMSNGGIVSWFAQIPWWLQI